MQSKYPFASAAARVSSETNNARNARKRILPERVHGNRKNFEVIRGKGSNEVPPPTTPAPAVWVPRNDRRAIVDAFDFGVGIHKLSARQRRPLKIIESILREELNELRGRIRTMENHRIALVQRRFAA